MLFTRDLTIHPLLWTHNDPVKIVNRIVIEPWRRLFEKTTNSTKLVMGCAAENPIIRNSIIQVPPLYQLSIGQYSKIPCINSQEERQLTADTYFHHDNLLFTQDTNSKGQLNRRGTTPSINQFYVLLQTQLYIYQQQLQRIQTMHLCTTDRFHPQIPLFWSKKYVLADFNFDQQVTVELLYLFNFQYTLLVLFIFHQDPEQYNEESYVDGCEV